VNLVTRIIVISYSMVMNFEHVEATLREVILGSVLLSDTTEDVI